MHYINNNKENQKHNILSLISSVFCNLVLRSHYNLESYLKGENVKTLYFFILLFFIYLPFQTDQKL